MAAKRVITFGEIMMRLNPEGYLRLVQSGKFEASYAGGEAKTSRKPSAASFTCRRWRCAGITPQ